MVTDAALRCAVHPSLPAVDICPVCERPRCASDATSAPGGCYACEGRRARTGPPPLDLRALVGAGCLSGIVAAFGGMIASEYVGAGWIGWVVPVFVGIVVSMAAEAGAGTKRGRALRYLAAFYSALAIAVSLQSPYAAETPFSLEWKVLALYALAVATSWYWTLPPRTVKPPEP